MTRLLPHRLPVTVARLICLSVVACSPVHCWGQQATEGQASDDQTANTAADTSAQQNAAGQSLFDGKTLTAWQTATQFDFSDHGKIEARDENIWLHQGDPATGIHLKKAPARINYEISLEAMRFEGSDFFCGLTFPVGPSYCTLIVGGWGGGVIGLSNVDGASAVENATTNWRDFKNDQWYKIRLRVTQEHIRVWIDDKLIIDQEVPQREFKIWWEMEPMRPLGIATWKSGSRLRKITFQHPAPKLKAESETPDSTDPSSATAND